MSTQKNENNRELISNPLKERIKCLMTEKELEAPYSFATRVGLSKGTFTGIWVDGRKSLHKTTLDKICETTGANPAWLATGIGDMFISSSVEPNNSILSESINIETRLDKSILEKAFFTLEQALNTTKKMMPTKDRAEFIAIIYKSLRENDAIELEVLADCIFTLEEALKLKRQLMSHKAKSELIFTIYELYSGNASYKDEMQSIINQLIGS